MIRRALLLVPSKPSETLSLVYGVLNRQRDVDAQTTLATERAFEGAPAVSPCSSTHSARWQANSAVVQLDVSRWVSKDVDLLELDREFHQNEDKNQDCELWICGEVDETPNVPFQVLTRYQRLLPLENNDLPVWFSDVLSAHRELFDLSKPLVRADFDHAHDTWRWVRRLQPNASLALQLAALFHDVERLYSEPDERVEHVAADYPLFKRKHAEGSARSVSEVMKHTETPEAVVDQVAELVSQHESPMGDEDLMLLNDADALSFFSLNSCAFVRYFDVAHVQKKVQYTLDRMRPASRSLLASLKLPPLFNIGSGNRNRCSVGVGR